MDKKYLYTIDTINQASYSKSSRNRCVTEDSLHLKMMENGQERLLKLESSINLLLYQRQNDVDRQKPTTGHPSFQAHLLRQSKEKAYPIF